MKIAFYLCNSRNHPNNVIKTAFDYCPFDKELYWLDEFTDDHAKTYDAHVTWGIWKKANPNTNNIKKIEELSPSHIIFEMGYIKRGYGSGDFYSVNIGGLNGKGKEYQTNNVSRLTDLGIKIKSPIKSRKGILVIGQVYHDSTVQDIDFEKWAISKLKDTGGYYRPHPLYKKPIDHDKICTCDTLPQSIETHQIGKVITFNSTAGIDALIEGCEVEADDQGSMLYAQPNRDSALIRVASRQFQLNEIPWEQIKKATTSVAV